MNAVLKKPLISNAIIKRTPMPLVYEEACRALKEVTTVMDAKYFADKADALAAWAKIYRSDQAAIEAKRLKLHAFRKMGELAEQLRPSGENDCYVKGKSGRQPGGQSLLIENGLKRDQARAAMGISRIPLRKFENLTTGVNPPALFLAARIGAGLGAKSGVLGSDSYRQLFSSMNGGGLNNVMSILRRSVKVMDVAGFHDSEVTKALEIAKEGSDWFDEFERRLQHRKSILSKKK